MSEASGAAQRDFSQVSWDAQLEHDCRLLVGLAVQEDLGRWFDWTTLALIPPEGTGTAAIVARRAGIVAGVPIVPLVLDYTGVHVTFEGCLEDGQVCSPGTVLGRLRGTVRDLLTCERLLLNFLGRLCGIATMTRQYVDAIQGTTARIYDTRKTTPGWRRLEKYAVRCGGGHNHRTGLFDAILIKDNHLAFAGLADDPAGAVRRARAFLRDQQASVAGVALADMLLEIEVDSLAQLAQVLPLAPDMVLLDNMVPEQLSEAVRMRNQAAVPTQLDASGGITLSNIRAIAATGVERISIGALTHSAVSLDLGLDWES